jgi:uroporphyrinogen-III decarboxylase
MMTKLVAEPIGPVYMAGTGATGKEDPEVLAIERALELSLLIILRSISAQIEAGAKMIILCEPAANLVYLSPKQLKKGADIFERFVMQPNLKVKALMDEFGVDLFFHDCGELMDTMPVEFARLRPAIMSLGSSRVLWEDAARLPKDIVLFGNLPTKKFFSDDLTIPDIERMGKELIAKMKEAHHPFILGSECDVLSVPGAQSAISSKVAAFCRCGL